jgi:MFS family permease
VWADKFGYTKKRRTTWLSALLFSSTIGVLIGYICTSILVLQFRWEVVFYIEAFCAIPFCVILALTPSRFLELPKEEDLGESAVNSGDATIYMSNSYRQRQEAMTRTPQA